MKHHEEKTGCKARTARETAGTTKSAFRPRAFDAVAYAAALEVLG